MLGGVENQTAYSGIMLNCKMNEKREFLKTQLYITFGIKYLQLLYYINIYCILRKVNIFQH